VEHNSLELNVHYKWGVINELAEPHRTEVLAYCSDLVNTYMRHLSDSELSHENLTPEYKSLPIPPHDKPFVERYDRYLPILIGLYCIKNKHRYEEVSGREWEKEFRSFREFVQLDLYVNFEYLSERYEKYASDPSKTESIDLTHYVSNVLSRSIKANIKVARKEVNRMMKMYF
jgi:hypothetical protein